MKTIVPIKAGPFPDKDSCIKWAIRNMYFSVFRDMRKGYHGWYIYDRSYGTSHLGSKKWRKWLKKAIKNNEESWRNYKGF